MMDTLRPSASRRGNHRRLRLIVLYKVLVILVLDDLRGILILQ
jgi:hypothetical protein